MNNRDNILHELQELQSMLATTVPQNTLAVPAGYFEGLAEQVLNKIKALEAVNAVDELNVLSPTLANLSKAMPYKVPQGYFEGLSEKMLSLLQENIQLSATEELESISPLLSGLKKEMLARPNNQGGPFSVPKGYFENTIQSPAKPEVKIVSITSRKWFRYVAAAVVVGVIAMAGLLVTYNNNIDPTTNSHAWVKKSIKKVSTDKLDQFIQLVDEDKSVENAVATADKNKQIKELVKDIPDSEIQNFLNDTEVLDDVSADETILN